MDNLQKTLEKLQGRFGADIIVRLEDRVRKYEVIPTGCLALDAALGIGGFPRKHIVEIYGPEASGKSALLTHFLGHAMEQGGLALLIDMERKGSPEWIKTVIEAFGGNADNLLVSQPMTGTAALDIVKAAIDEVDAIGVDSVAKLVTPKEIDAEAEDQHPALLARLMSQNLKAITPLIGTSKTVLVFTNQIRYKFVQFGDPETTPGGQALKHDAVIRVRLRKMQSITRGKETVGIRTQARVTKNQAAAPYRTAEYDLYFDRGIDWIKDVMVTAEMLGVIERSGSFYSWNPEEDYGFKVQGKEALEKLFKEPVAGEKLATGIREDVLRALDR